MPKSPSIVYEFSTFALAVLVTIGSWLPWVRKIPVGYDDGQPYYTDEWVLGLNPGFHALDYVLMLLALVAVAAPLLARYWGLSASGIVTGSGIAILLVAGGLSMPYLGQYVIEPGLYLVLVGGFLLIVLGILLPRNRALSNDGMGFSPLREQ